MPAQQKAARWTVYLKIAAGVIFIVALLVLLLWGVHQKKPIISPGTDTLPEPQPEIEEPPIICNSTECVEASAWIQETMNVAADPCEDFYEFACGRFSNVHPIPENKSFVSTLSLLQDKVTDSLYKLMVREVQRRKSGRGGGGGGGGKRVAKSIDLAADLFDVCMDEESRNRLDVEPFAKQLKQMLGIDWPIIDKDAFEKNFLKGRDSVKLFIDAMATFRAAGSEPIMKFGPDIDANNTLHKLITFKVPDFDLETYQYTDYVNHEYEIGANWEYMRNMAKFFYLKPGVVLDSDAFDRRFHEVFNFERSLADYVNQKSNPLDPKDWYFKTSLRNLNALTRVGSFNWTSLLFKTSFQFDLPYQITEEEQVLVRDVEYYKRMAQLVATTPLYTIFNYMGVRYISERGDDGSARMHEQEFQFAQKTQGLKAKPHLWEGCLEEVRTLFPMPLARLYVDEVVPRETKVKAQGIIDRVAESFAKTIKKHTPWLDKVTRDRAEEKLAKIKYLVGYPDWIFDNTQLDEDWGLRGSLLEDERLKILPGRYFDSLNHIRRFAVAREWRQLKKVHNPDKDWIMSPTTANVDYSSVANTIIVPVGLLQPPLFDPFRADYMNYATLGAYAAHTLTHHFDDKGSRRDRQSRLLDWWSPTTRAHFDQETACFVRKYSQAVDLQTGKKLNGAKSVSENIADNGGIRQAFYAFEKAYKMAVGAKEARLTRLKTLEQFNVEQLFFIVLAKDACADYRLEHLKTKIDKAFIPPRSRVNLALGNLPPFAATFKCPPSSKLNPRERCRIW